MTDLIQRLTAGIIKQEGMPVTYKNPGNLRAAPWLQHPVIEKGFWVPASRDEGIAGLAHVIALRIAMGQNLRQLISAYAPPSDGNQTEAYITHMKDWCQVSNESEPLYNLL